MLSTNDPPQLRQNKFPFLIVVAIIIKFKTPKEG